jgi:hypothetical protein
MNKNKWFLNGGRGSGRTIRLLCETYENKIEDLEKENANVKEALEGYKKIAKWCDKCDKIAELKSENQKWKDEWQEQVQKATDEGYARTLQTMQLNKAKEIIKEYIELKYKPCAVGNSVNMLLYDNICAEAEQFLSEVEK